MTLPIALFLFLAASLLFWLSWRQRKTAGLPAGRVIYADTLHWAPVETPLYDEETGLTGRPDYLVQEHGQPIPVEVKSSRAGDAPFDAHIYQLAAYCLLVQRCYGKRPPYGILHYANRTFAVDFTPTLEAALLETLSEIRHSQRRKEVHRSHENAARCRGCGYRKICTQRLTQ